MINALLILAIVVLSVLTFRGHRRNQAAAAENGDAEAQFLAENKHKEGVVELDCGVQMLWHTRNQAGEQPSAKSKVTVHYRGTLLDGSEFDNSQKRGQPLTFKLNQVISGWQQGLLAMHAGERATLYIPAKLAYGNRRVGNIAPASLLIFDVELIAVN